MRNRKKKYSDKEIVEGIVKSDDRVLQRLYKDNEVMIFNLVLKNSGTEDEAAEILHEGIIAFFENVKEGKFKLQDNCRISSYIYQVCRNKWFKKLEARKKEPDFMDTEKFLNSYDYLEEEEEEIKEEVLQQLAGYMQQLGEKCQKILNMFYYLRNNMTKIAEKLGYTNAANAKNQKAKCIKQLKTMFGLI